MKFFRLYFYLCLVVFFSNIAYAQTPLPHSKENKYLVWTPTSKQEFPYKNKTPPTSEEEFLVTIEGEYFLGLYTSALLFDYDKKTGEKSWDPHDGKILAWCALPPPYKSSSKENTYLVKWTPTSKQEFPYENQTPPVTEQDFLVTMQTEGTSEPYTTTLTFYYDEETGERSWDTYDSPDDYYEIVAWCVLPPPYKPSH